MHLRGAVSTQVGIKGKQVPVTLTPNNDNSNNDDSIKHNDNDDNNNNDDGNDT